jgi:xanthine dehydrogenase accessory factor
VKGRRDGEGRIATDSADVATSLPTAAPAEIFSMLLRAGREGRRFVLATIVAITGTGARAVGTHMAVLDNGDSAGSFSSGCVEAAIVAEALEVLRAGKPRVTRFGQGSPYIDIRLPCGGGMDIVFLPDLPLDLLEQVVARFDRREGFTLSLGMDGRVVIDGAGDFVVRHVPPLKLVLLGHGAEMLATLRLGLAHGAAVEILSPEEEILSAGAQAGVPATHLLSPAAPAPITADAWTAMLFLFHDHDWEPVLLARAVETPAFWIGAMGSRRTQAARHAALEARGIGPERIGRIRGPVGLIPAARDPATLALSAFAEIVAAYHAIIR